MLGFIQLLNSFPHALALNALEDHRENLNTFMCTPMTLEQEAWRRMSVASGQMPVPPRP
jgi:hypothetical protein